ncbi:M20/M25/M40 family metallo-hydrolase [Undibacterium cyanobacteriorum]|uniref:M20/M25/M40 family metallo-hydrolase n=1 Tax=Undibacterium cyanobacteriorum TaxID=3073561 RepID=A0ABY9RHU2_9BURK|nr:M20/M25/M40 family metallo-hydrolase [Undibacterium sp. 20NA77.5]WMW79872.1 M20/M25/M40 family metallo-hydrolase [Undibacterium sp. 20NA77.5]
MATAVGLSLAVLVPSAIAQNQTVTNKDYTQVGREILAELVASKPVHEQGSTKAAQLLASRLRAAGFAEQDLHLLAPADHPHKGNLVVRLRGKTSDNATLFIGHLDVVEAKREDWNFDPFVLTEKDGWLYGRGVIDMLGQDSAMATSLIRLKQEGHVPQRDIIVAFTADEEAGGEANGVDWLLRNKPELVKAGLVINPDAGEAAIKNGKKLYLTMQTSEKMFLSFELEVTDKGGHSSRPTKDNPIYRLSKALARLSDHAFPLHLTETVKLYFKGRAALEKGQVKQDMLAVAAAQADLSAARRLSQEVETNIQMRTTCTVTEINGGHAENALPQRVKATMQCRVVPGETQAQTEALLKKVVNDPSVKFSVRTPARPSPESPPSAMIRQTVESVTHSMWPEIVVLPSMTAGASDSIYTRAAGLPTYGIDAMFDDLDDGRAHGRDERIHKEVFAQEIEFIYRLMKKLDQSNFSK